MSSMWRSRWAAVGAAVAVTLGAGGLGIARAAVSTGEKPVYVPLDAPCRVIDTRSSSPIGAGDGAALTVQVTGANGDCTGPLAIPTDAVGVSTNVTAIQPKDAVSGRSYFTVYPADATRPTTSNLNFVNGQPPTPNKVDVGLSADGKIKIYNFDGTAHAAVDVFGYYIDHNHDDRYYTEAESQARFNPVVGQSVNDAALTASLAQIASVTLNLPDVCPGADTWSVLVQADGYFLTSGAATGLATVALGLAPTTFTGGSVLNQNFASAGQYREVYSTAFLFTVDSGSRTFYEMGSANVSVTAAQNNLIAQAVSVSC